MRHDNGAIASVQLGMVATGLLLVAGLAGDVAAQQLPAAELVRRVGLEQRLGARIPAELAFVDEAGRAVRLGDLFGPRPAVLALVYYECPMLCDVVAEGLIGALRSMNLEVGRDFDVVTVSIDPGENAAVAAAKKQAYLEEYGRAGDSVRDGWHVLTGEAQAIERLAVSVGFRYVYDAERDEYAHPAGIMVVTPDGRLARYFYGVSYPARDLRLGLVEASAGGVGSLADQVLLLCYHYDPASGRYGFAIWAALRAFGIVTVLALGAFIVVMVRRERRAELPANRASAGNVSKAPRHPHHRDHAEAGDEAVGGDRAGDVDSSVSQGDSDVR